MWWSRRLKGYFLSVKIRRADVILAVILAVLSVLCTAWSMPLKDALQKQSEISLGYSAKQGDNGLYYVLDSGHERLSCFDETGRIRFTIEEPPRKEGGLFYMNDFSVEENGLYVSAAGWEGMAVTWEAILFYDENGNYVRTVCERDYPDGGINKSRFYGIQGTGVSGDMPRFVECLLDHVVINGREIPFENAFHGVSDAVFVGNTAYILDKNGTIREFSEGVQKGDVLYSLSSETDKNVVPFRLAADENGEIYFTDIRNRQVRLVDRAGKNSTSVCESAGSLTVNFAKDGAFLLLDEDGLHVAAKDGAKDFLVLKKNGKTVLFQAVWLGAACLCLVFSCVLILRFLCCFLRRKHDGIRMIAFCAAGTAMVVSVLLCGLLMNAFAASYREKIEEQLEGIAWTVANQIQGGDIERVEETGGFGGEAYNRLRGAMERSFPKNIEFYSQLYCNILKMAEDESTGYAVAYLDQSIGSFFPLDSVESEELKAVYDTGKAVWDHAVADISGTYLSVKVPVFDDTGKVGGAVAVGVDTYVITDTLRGLLAKILMSALAILMLVYLISVEILSIAGQYSLFREKRASGETNVLPGHWIRLLVFLIFTAYNMPSTFLPVYLIRKTGIFPEGARELAGALPITVNVFLIGVMSLFCANLVRKHGICRILMVSAACSFGGNLLIYLMPGFYAVCAGLVLDGIGVGLITNAVYVLLTYVEKEEDRTRGFSVYNGACFSGINFGMMLGSLLAVSAGQRFVFGIVSLSWLFLLSLTGIMMGKGKAVPGALATEKEDAEDREKTSRKDKGQGISTEISTGRFLRSRPVVLFFALVQNPYIIFGSFVFYYVPVFCDERGYGETICSFLIMLYSQAAVLFADNLTGWFSRTLKDLAMYAALFMNLAAILIFAAFPNMGGMVAALLCMGLGASYGKPVQQNYFLELGACRKYGEDKSMGIYNFSENIGESLGPAAFGGLMSSARFEAAAGVFFSILSSLGLAHYLIMRKSRAKGRETG